ncbi:MAG: zinc ribbon domain-containing protein [Xanthomonadales bacterium]|nr:zinc ribbon domain-containing protein [Xanthomonadales bacterium]
MPIYEYRCRDCGHELERLQKMSDAPLRDCPSCGEQGLQRLISAAGFRLKGSGWYETDFKKDGKRNLADGDKPPAAESKDSKSDSAAKSDARSDSKSESKPDKKPAAAPSSDAA